MMMALDVIIRLAELGADLPVNVVLQHEDKYYDIESIEFDDEIYEFVIFVQEGSENSYSSRGDLLYEEREIFDV